MTRRRGVVTTADEQVSIIDVCRWVGVDVPEDAYLGRSMKVRCPFGEFYHSDGGQAAAMRIYPPDNTCYCFSCGYSYTPVKLAARAWDMRYTEAAATLLERIGYKPVSLAQAWADVVTHTPPVQRTLLAEALKTFCRRVDPHWDDRQFDTGIAGQLNRCLALLDHVTTDEQARLWLDGCKTAMRRVLAPSIQETR